MTLALEQYLTDASGLIGKYLDAYFGNWRQGNANADYILWVTPVGFTVSISLGGTPGVLDIDGVKFYSADWL